MSLPNTLQTLRNRVISECELHPELKDKLHEIYFMAKSEVEDEESEESEVEMGLEAIDELMLVKENTP